MDKIEVLHLGVGAPPKTRLERGSARSSVGIDPSAPLIVSASRLSPQKALHVLLDAMSLLPPEVVLVIGDVMLDEFVWGDVTRISPEAPVPVVTEVPMLHILQGSSPESVHDRAASSVISAKGV